MYVHACVCIQCKIHSELFTATTRVGVGALCSVGDGGCQIGWATRWYVGAAFSKLMKLSYVQFNMETWLEIAVYRWFKAWAWLEDLTGYRWFKYKHVLVNEGEFRFCIADPYQLSFDFALCLPCYSRGEMSMWHMSLLGTRWKTRSVAMLASLSS